MKKTYISPLATEVSVVAEPLLVGSASLTMNNETLNTNTSQLSNERRGTWGNLWY